MREAVISFMKKHQLIKSGKTVIVGVSGGPDSMALLHFLRSIQSEFNLKLIAVSVDHQLRGDESEADLFYVQEMCKKWKIDFYGTSVDVPSYKQTRKLGTEVAARVLRYQVFSEQMERLAADYVVLGHHGDDQIETMLMGLVRTANPKALAGIPFKRSFAGGFIVRPFLCITKAEIEHYCLENNIIPRRDPTNEETIYTRNYFRKKVLPLIKTQNSNIHTTVQHLSESIQADVQFLDMEANNLFPQVVKLDKRKRQATLEIDEFVVHPSALQRRVFHLILNYLYNELPKDLSYVHEEQFFALLTNQKANVRVDFPYELKVEKAYRKLNFYFGFLVPDMTEFDETIVIPGEISLPDGSTFRTEFMDESSETDKNIYVCGNNEVVLPLHIRTRRSGDRISWKGLNGSKKIKDIFIDAKIPLTERDKWPIVTDNNGEILWLAGLKKGQPRKQSNSTSYIYIYYDKGNV